MAITGRAALLVLLGVVPVGLLPGWWSFLTWLVVVATVLVADVRLAVDPRTLQVTRQMSTAVRLGELTTAELQIYNPHHRVLRGQVRDAWEPSAGATPTAHEMLIPAGCTAVLRTGLQPTRRGDRRSDTVAICCLGPLGFAGRQVSLPSSGRLRVLPPFDSRKLLPSRLARLRELDGSTQIRSRGQGTEFDSLRDYVIGDDVRAIDWRATARRQQVVIRTWRPERDRRVLLVLDTSRLSAGRVGSFPRLDAGLDAALLLAALADRAGDRVDVLAMDAVVRAQLQGVRGKALLPKLMNRLANVEASLVEADWTSMVTTMRTMVSQRALIVVVTSLETPAAVEASLVPALAHLHEHQVVVASVSDPQLVAMTQSDNDVAGVYAAAAAQRAMGESDALAAELRRGGIQVVTGTPDELPGNLADRYLALKAAGQL